MKIGKLGSTEFLLKRAILVISRLGEEKRRKKKKELECGPMPNLMVALPNSNAAKTRYPLKYDGVPQTRQSISAVSGPKFTIL